MSLLARKRSSEEVAAIQAKKNVSGITFSGLIKTVEDNERSKDSLDITTNQDNSLKEFPKKEFKLWVVKEPNSSEKLGGSETIVRSQHYGQAVDDYIIDWNKRKRLNRTIGYPVVQGKKI